MNDLGDGRETTGPFECVRRPAGSPSRGLALLAATFLLAAGAFAEDRAQIEFVPQVGHARGMFAVFSPHGSHVLSGSDDTTLKLWAADTGYLIRTFSGHTGIVNSVAFSPDGVRIISGSDDTTIKLWDARSGALLRTFSGNTSVINSVAFSPDGARIASAAGTGW